MFSVMLKVNYYIKFKKSVFKGLKSSVNNVFHIMILLKTVLHDKYVITDCKLLSE